MDKNRNKYEIKKEFTKKIARDVLPDLKVLEAYRIEIYKRIKRNSILFKIIFCLTIVASTYFVAIKQTNPLPFFLILIFGMPFLYKTLCGKHKLMEKGFCLNLKQQYLNKILEAFGNIKWFNNSNILSEFEIRKSELLGQFSIRNADDEFIGKYNDIEFKISEVNLKQEEYEKGKKKVHTIFEGIILQLALENPFKTRIEIYEKYDFATKHNNGILQFVAIVFGILGLYALIKEFNIKAFIVCISTFWLIFWVLKYQKDRRVVLEDVEFDKRFAVSSDDQIESRCILTPAFMERFLKLKRFFNADCINCAFYENKIMFAFETNKNIFELGSSDKSLLDAENFKNLFDEINAVYEIIDCLKLEVK